MNATFRPVPEHLRDIFLAAGLSVHGRHGQQLADMAAFQARVSRAVCRPELIVHSSTERDRLARSAAQLRDEVFGDLGDVEPPLRDELARRIWDLVQTGPTGHVQRRLGETGEPLLLCRARVERDGQPIDVCYVTDDPGLMMKDNFQRDIDRFLAQVESLSQDLEMVLGRHPEMEPAVREANVKALRKIYDSFGLTYPEAASA
jgi:hypothetical protein